MKKIILIILTVIALISCNFTKMQFITPTQFPYTGDVAAGITMNWSNTSENIRIAYGNSESNISIEYEPGVKVIANETDGGSWPFEFIPRAQVPGLAELHINSPSDIIDMLLNIGLNLTPGNHSGSYQEGLAVIDLTTQAYDGQRILSITAPNGIFESGPTEELTGNLIVNTYSIVSDNSFLAGSAEVIFRDGEYGGLLYLSYNHGNGFQTIMYAHSGDQTATGTYFPDCNYTYYWHFFLPDNN
ncbi:MAG: hypothetical protein ACLFR1_07640 [Spirochaetia bacterium]